MDWRTLLIVFFYNQIKQIVSRLLGGFGLTIPIDYILLAIGYWKRTTWWGQGLLYGAVASLGQSMGAGILGGLGVTTQAEALEKKTETYEDVYTSALAYAQGLYPSYMR